MRNKMLRHSSCRFLAETISKKILCVGLNNPLLQEFKTEDQFHVSRQGYLSNLYEITTATDPFSEVIKYNGVRLMVSAPVTIGKYCKRVPFLIDTGCETTMIHQITFNKFIRSDQEVPSSVLIGSHRVTTTLNTFTTEEINVSGKKVEVPHLLGYLNLLGMNFLNEAVPDLHKHLHDNLSKYQPPLESVIVTDGNMTFRVRPKESYIMDLKKAIVDHMKYDFASPYLIVKDRSGIELKDRDRLHAGTEYVFELPQ